MIRFSIIICVHDPEVKLFARLAAAILKFGKTAPAFEVIFVDNNCSVPLDTFPVVKDLQQQLPFVKQVKESKPGLSHARVAGVAVAAAEWLIFFDDDNEPCANYLEAAAEAIAAHPEVGAWGPGHIKVEYMEAQFPQWLQHAKFYFQERAASGCIFDNQKAYQACYPNGTGLVIKKVHALSYANAIEKGTLSLTDRSGKSLSSGGDTQMVMIVIRDREFAGVCAHMQLTHMISTEKMTLSYLKKQVYRTAASYFSAYNEVYPGTPLNGALCGSKTILASLYAAIRIHFSKEARPFFHLRCARILGEYASPYYAAHKRRPFLIKLAEKFFINE